MDGAGKTTLQRGLAEALRAEGRAVLETKEPTEGPLGRRIRAIAAAGRGEVSAEEELALFHEDRRQHVAERVRPALARGEVVIQDRSYFSTIAYQGQRGLDRARIRTESEAIAPRPDLLLILDLPPEEALARIRRGRSAADDFEGLASLTAVREVFLGFTEAVVLDARRPADALQAAARAALAAVETRRARED